MKSFHYLISSLSFVIHYNNMSDLSLLGKATILYLSAGITLAILPQRVWKLNPLIAGIIFTMVFLFCIFLFWSAKMSGTPIYFQP